MMFWRSVVGKLWITILLLVSFVLFILTVMLMEFFENYHINETRKGMTNTAEKIARVLEDHPGEEEQLGLEIAWEMVDDDSRVTVIKDKDTYFYSPGGEAATHVPISFFMNDRDLSTVFEKDKTVDIITPLPGISNEVDDTQYLMIGVPLHQFEQGNGAVFIYQSLEVMEETTRLTTKFILLAAGVAIVLTTIFAFFLSTRITAPLRKMREAAFEVARGKFDTKVPILTHDEIGELATAFNQMGRQLKFNMNALSQEKEQLTSILSSMADRKSVV